MSLTCFICNANFNFVNIYCDHLKYDHGVPSLFDFNCNFCNCNQSFQNMHAFKKHLKLHLPVQDSQSFLDNQNDHSIMSINNTFNETFNELPNVDVESTVNCQEINEFNIENSVGQIEKSLINFTLKMHSRNSFTRKDTEFIVQSVNNIITKPIPNFISSYIVPKIENIEHKNNILLFVDQIEQNCSIVETEYKLLKYICDIGLYKLIIRVI